MSLADDLRATAVDHVAVVLTSMLSNGSVRPERLAQAAVDVAGAFLVDAERVDIALAAREPADTTNGRPRLMPPVLWDRAGGDEARYLELMQEQGWLELATIPRTGGAVPE